MGLVDKYRWGNVSNFPVSNIEIDSLSTLESIKRRQGWMIAAQVATVAAIAHQTHQTTDALRLVNDTLISIEGTIQDGFYSLESSIESLESNLIENLNEIKWYLFNVDQKLDKLINLIKFSGATKSAEYNKQGFILYKIGFYNDAINQLNRSVQENPLNIEAYINLGFVYLREEKLEESIFNFEKASKLVKEDFSYFEEVSQESLKSTEVFILDNLATLYSLQKKHDQSIDSLNKILSKEIDKKTEVLSKYKLSKYLCISGDHDSSLELIKELIINQYFEPVALAVTNPEFEPISARILSILQNKLEAIKKTFEVDGSIGIEKLQITEIDSKTKSLLTDVVLKVTKAINDSSNYSVLLTSEFKELHNEFLLIIELLSELKSKSEKDLKYLALDYFKLESIKNFNNQMDSNYTNVDDVLVLSHKLLLSKVKSNVESGIDDKINQFNLAIKLSEDLAKRADFQIMQLDEIPQNSLIQYINADFSLTSIIDKLKIKTVVNENDEQRGPVNTKNNNNANLINISFDKKVTEEYDSLFAKYQSKEKISTFNLNKNGTLDAESNDEAFLEKYQSKVNVVARVFDISFEKASEIMKDPDLFIKMVKSLSSDKRSEIYDVFNDKKND